MMHGCCISKCSWQRDAANCSQPLHCCSSSPGKALGRLCHHQPDFASPTVPPYHQREFLGSLKLKKAHPTVRKHQYNKVGTFFPDSHQLTYYTALQLLLENQVVQTSGHNRPWANISKA